MDLQSTELARFKSEGEGGPTAFNLTQVQEQEDLIERLERENQELKKELREKSRALDEFMKKMEEERADYRRE